MTIGSLVTTDTAGIPLPAISAFTPFVEFPVRATVRIQREPGATKCVNCQLRRVVYRVVVGGLAGSDQTEKRCAPCWGIAK